MDEIQYVTFRPNFQVTDLERGAAFYRDVLGFDLVTLSPEFGLALLAKDGAEVALVKTDQVVARDGFLYVKGVDILYEKCRIARAEIVSEPITRPWGIKDFVVKDPDANVIAVGERLL